MKAGGWRRRAFASLTVAAAATLTIGGLYWTTPEQRAPASLATITSGYADPRAATPGVSPAIPVESPDSAVPAESQRSAIPAESPDPAPSGVATRLVIAYLGVDLPVLPDYFEVPGNPNAYPLCDVAQYLSAYGQPGVPGAIYLYAHARRGMLLPLLEASKVDDGAALLGQLAMVYASDGSLHVYRIFVVKRHATDLSLADEIAPGEERLVIQTSEGPTGTVPKLQIAAHPISSEEVPQAPAPPSAEPRVCAPSS